MADPSSMAVVAFVTSWCTPTSLFLFLNLMIGTLVFSSRFTISAKDKGRHSDNHRDSDSAPSLLNRVKSFNFSQYCNFDYPQYTQHEQYTETDHAPPLTRAPSVLQRLKSVNFTQFRFDRSAHTPAAAETVQEKGPDPEYTAQPLLQRLKSINFWHDNTNPKPNPEPVQRRREPPPLARVPSFLARVKSINFSLYGQDNEYTPEEVNPVVPVEDHHVQRVNSDTQPSGGEAPSKLYRKMRKSASHKSAFGHFGHEKTVDDPVELRPRPESVREGRKKIGFAGDVHEEEEEHIDSKADDFINKFRQQLKLQRLDSIVRYKEMLTRAHAAH